MIVGSVFKICWDFFGCQYIRWLSKWVHMCVSIYFGYMGVGYVVLDWCVRLLSTMGIEVVDNRLANQEAKLFNLLLVT